LNVEYFSETNNSTNIEIISNEGKTLISKQVSLQEGINILQLEIADLSADIITFVCIVRRICRCSFLWRLYR